MPVRHTQVVARPKTGGFQSVAYTGTAGTISNALSSGVDKIQVKVTTDAHVAIVTGSGVATTTDFKCYSDRVYDFIAPAGAKVSAIKASGASDGTLEVSEYTL